MYIILYALLLPFPPPPPRSLELFTHIYSLYPCYAVFYSSTISPFKCPVLSSLVWLPGGWFTTTLPGSRSYETINEQQWIFPMMDLSKRYTCSLEKNVGKGLNDFYFIFNHVISQNRNATDNWWFWDTLILWLNTHLTSPYSHMAKKWYPKT